MNGPTTPEERERRGWIFYDWANQVFQTSVITVFLSLYLTGVAEADARARGQACTGDSALVHCDVDLLGFDVAAGSVFGYLVSLATVLQVLVLPITGAIADRTQDKRRMLGISAFVGSAATAALALTAGTSWQLGFVLFLVANTAYGASIVIYYAFLPELAGPDGRDALSARGWAFGYLGGGLALLLHLAIYLGRDLVGLSESDAVRICFLTAGLWWAAFTLIPLRRLRRHQAPQGSERGAAVVTAGFRQLADTLRHARGVPLTLAFLGSYLIFADGITTVAQIAGLYGERELLLPREVLIVTILIVQFVAFVGAVLHGRIAARFGAKRTILGSLVGWTVVVTGAYFVTAGQQLQFYAVAFGIGLVLGGTLALTRSLFSQMVPPGREAEYFALYEIGEKGTSWLGPLVFAAVADATGSFRPAIISLIVFFVVGGALLAMVPVKRAIRAAGNEEPAVL
ncbi:MFS transporter [Pseudonocardia abyssalis]|uniref:MFS transporter n=1 Tax=Pseudonocardia abyssalis TaxID=2792008 RepID=A0ABS6UPE5_9PSEU|nr:MFS transporter [Pseudonocardia abyssalis]MBW0116864.1 MFS transporter [Pseudonocardia abyssalis]MBW0134124.1 MFS transporter [Pseudonocardia abyssalis]